MANTAYSYKFSDYLSQIPGYTRADTATLLKRAKAAADLAADPQRQEAERQAKLNELQSINNTQKIKRANVGVDESLAYNNAQAKKSAAIRAAGSGAVGSSGLSDYLNNMADASTQAQRLNIAATMAGSLTDETNRYQGQVDDTNQLLKDIEINRGKTQSSLYDEYEAAQDTAEQNWNQNALSVALGIGEGELNAADLNQRKVIEDNRIAAQLYEANLPYTSMTQYQKGQLDLDTTVAMGKTAGSKKSSSGNSGSKSSSGKSANSNLYGLRKYAEQSGVNVGYDASTGNVTVGSKTYTPAQLASMGGFINNSGRWVLPASSLSTLFS